MPIKVQCACGKAFAAKDELAGKTVKCPGCQKPLKIPGAAASPPAGAAKPAAKPAPTKPASKPAPAKQPAKSRPAPAAAPAGGDGTHLFDEVGLQAAAEGTHPCRGCTEPMPIQAVVCVKCGYNTRLGRRMETVKLGGASDGPVGHGAVADDLMSRAAQVIDGDAAEDKKKTKEGLPWWVYGLFLSALIGLATWMLFNWGIEPPKDDEKKSWLPSDTPSALA